MLQSGEMDDESISSSDRAEKWFERTSFCSAFFSLSEATGLGGTWGLLEEAERLGCENPSTSTRILSTLTLVGEHLEDDESSFEVAVFKGPAEPLSPVLIGRMFLREPSWKYSAKLVGS